MVDADIQTADAKSWRERASCTARPLGHFRGTSLRGPVRPGHGRHTRHRPSTCYPLAGGGLCSCPGARFVAPLLPIYSAATTLAALTLRATRPIRGASTPKRWAKSGEKDSSCLPAPARLPSKKRHPKSSSPSPRTTSRHFRGPMVTPAGRHRAAAAASAAAAAAGRERAAAAAAPIHALLLKFNESYHSPREALMEAIVRRRSPPRAWARQAPRPRPPRAASPVPPGRRSSQRRRAAAASRSS